MYPRGRLAPPACSDPCLINVLRWKKDMATRRLSSTCRNGSHKLHLDPFFILRFSRLAQHLMPYLLAQSLALMQWRAGRLQEARELFQEAVTNCPPHAPLWAAWANVEVCDDPTMGRAVGQCVGTTTKLTAA